MFVMPNTATRKTVNILTTVYSTTKGGINLYIELEKHKLNHIAARNVKMSLEKRVAISE